MKILIPREGPFELVNPNYVHAIDTLVKRAYYPTEFDIVGNLRDSWAHFKDEVVSRQSIVSFYLTDFHVLDSEDISPLERIIYGVK